MEFSENLAHSVRVSRRQPIKLNLPDALIRAWHDLRDGYPNSNVGAVALAVLCMVPEDVRRQAFVKVDRLLKAEPENQQDQWEKLLTWLAGQSVDAEHETGEAQRTKQILNQFLQLAKQLESPSRPRAAGRRKAGGTG